MKRHDFSSLIAVGIFRAFRPVVMIPGPEYTFEEQLAFARNIRNEDIRFILYTEKGPVWAPQFQYEIITEGACVNVRTDKVLVPANTALSITGCQLITNQDHTIFDVCKLPSVYYLKSKDVLSLNYTIRIEGVANETT